MRNGAQFNDMYSKYYDLIYKNKDYNSESMYVLDLLKKYGLKSFDSVVELGCGTGKHAPKLLEVFSKWYGVDLSSAMIEKAKINLVKYQQVGFKCQNVNEFEANEKNDVALSLFHVASYQTSNATLEAYFSAAAKALKPGGYFLFDYWYGPAVISDPPQNKLLEVSNEEISVVRRTTPIEHDIKNVIDVKFDVNIRDIKSDRVEDVTETHSMRYLFTPEVAYFAAKAGFEVLGEEQWMTGKSLSRKTWYGVSVLRRLS